MAKLRKMLGDVNSPVCMEIMALIATQSQKTIERWAVEYAAGNTLPLYRAEYPEETLLAETVKKCRCYMAGGMKLSQLKPVLSEARKLASATKGDIAQAAARAVSAACASVQTPTNAFGFLMYAAAASAYATLGTDRVQQEYDVYAQAQMEKALVSLKSVAVENEPNPVKVDWHC